MSTVFTPSPPRRPGRTGTRRGPTATGLCPTAAETRLASMSLRDKLWQMLIVHPTDLSAASLTKPADDMAEALAAHPVGGIFFN